MSESVSIEVESQRGATVIALGAEVGDLDDDRVDEVAVLMLEAAKTASPPYLVVDLSQTKYFGSSFLGILFRVWNRIRARQGGRFAICGLRDFCADVIETAHLNELWDIFDSCEDAIASLKN